MLWVTHNLFISCVYSHQLVPRGSSRIHIICWFTSYVYSDHRCDDTHDVNSHHMFIHIICLFRSYVDSHHVLMTHSYVWRHTCHIICLFRSYACACRHTCTSYVYSHHMCDVTHPFVWYDAKQTHMGLFATTRRVTWLIHMCDMTPSYHLCDVTHPYVCRKIGTHGEKV